MSARRSAFKDKTHGKMVNPIAWPPLPRQTRLTGRLLMPSTAREAKEARARKARVRKAGKGNDADAQAYKPPTQSQTGAETRQCYNCCEYGHLGKDCKQPDRRKAAGAAARSLEETASQAGSQGSVRSLASALGGMRLLCTMRVTDADGWTTRTRILSDNHLFCTVVVLNVSITVRPFFCRFNIPKFHSLNLHVSAIG